MAHVNNSMHPDFADHQSRPSAKRSHITKANGKVYRLCISLLGVEPEIWRRVEVVDITLAKRRHSPMRSAPC